jgi:hypothetical protein
LPKELVSGAPKELPKAYSAQLRSYRVGKAYAISDVIEGRYFYPRGMKVMNLRVISISKHYCLVEPDGLQGDITTESRPLKEGETMEWIMLSGVSIKFEMNRAKHNG